MRVFNAAHPGVTCTALVFFAACDAPSEPMAPESMMNEPGVEIVDQTPRRHLPISTLIDALRDPDHSTGELLVAVKEAGAVRGVSTRGQVPSVAARLLAESNIRIAFPELIVTKGIIRHFPVVLNGVLTQDSIAATHIVVMSDGITAPIIQQIRSHPNVDFIEPNWRSLQETPPPGGSPSSPDIQMELMSTFDQRTWALDTIRAPDAWSMGYSGARIDIGLVDTGWDNNLTWHPAFVPPSDYLETVIIRTARLTEMRTCSSDDEACWHEEALHGTTVLGSAVATKNGEGGVGVAPAPLDFAHVEIVGYLEGGHIYVDDDAFVVGVDWITENWDYEFFHWKANIRIGLTGVIATYNPHCNDSSSCHQSLWDAFKRAWWQDYVLWFAAAGNTGILQFPAYFSETVAIGGLDRSGGKLVRADFSPIHERLDFVMPAAGLEILPVNRRHWASFGGWSSDLAYNKGTSAAVGLAAGVGRLVMEREQYPFASQLRNHLVWSARDLGESGHDSETGFGMLDAYCAIRDMSNCSPDWGLAPKPPSLESSIIGPGTLRHQQFCTWVASVSGGSAPYTYSWYRGGTVVSQTSEYTGSLESQGSFTLELHVTDSGSASSQSQIQVFEDPNTPECLL